MALELERGRSRTHCRRCPASTTVRRERVVHVRTDAGPQWIGANQLWNGQWPASPPTKGEGVVIGVIDTGINPTHPSFAASGADGYTITNPRGHFYGLCASGQAQCNAKLIGIYDFTDEGTKGVDTVGHGSHVSGIAAGNAIDRCAAGQHGIAVAQRLRRRAARQPHHVQGAAMREPIDASTDGTCAESALVAAIDQAIADQVDVINYSIGGDTVDPYRTARRSDIRRLCILPGARGRRRRGRRGRQ